jgi:RNA polymerase sigma factor (sigma-70 family)
MPVGDEPAEGEVMVRLEALYRREHRDLVRLAHLLLGDGARAEELVQDAFVRLLPHLEGNASPGGYLRTIVVNLCRDEQRRAVRARRHLHARPVSAPPPGIPERSTAVWMALQGLPARQREALSLRFYADLPTEEIARILDVRPATVRSLVHRGLATLKEVVPRD